MADTAPACDWGRVWPSRSRTQGAALAGCKGNPEDAEPHGWRRWAERVAARPWLSAIAALIVLVVLALPIFQLELGQNDLSALPKSTTARQNYDQLTKGFGPGLSGPLLVTAKFKTAAEGQKVLPGLETPTAGRLDVEGVGTGVPGGAADALSRP